jgi:hypothetical protein
MVLQLFKIGPFPLKRLGLGRNVDSILLGEVPGLRGLYERERTYHKLTKPVCNPAEGQGLDQGQAARLGFASAGGNSGAHEPTDS